MKKVQLIPVTEQDKAAFIADIQKTFQIGYETEFGPCPEVILPTKDIENSFSTKGAEAYFAIVDKKSRRRCNYRNQQQNEPQPS